MVCLNSLLSSIHRASAHWGSPFSDLTRMYHLLSRIPNGIDPMLDVLQKYVTDYGFGAIRSIPETSTKVPPPKAALDAANPLLNAP